MTAYDALFDLAFTRVDAERAHHLGFAAIRAGTPLTRSVGSGLDRLASRRGPAPEPVHALGLTFPNPLGLAAGFDKNAVGIDALAALGFGHVEIGTVTALAQPGNPKPRLFRLPADRAIVNRMGFNNDGARVVAERLSQRSETSGTSGPVVGVNIGKSKVVDEGDQAAVQFDYETSARLLAPHADYLVVNVSSPNTPGLRSLQAVERLGPLLSAVRATIDDVASGTRQRVPLLVKIAPDLDDAEVGDVADLARDLGLDGMIATNTTISREGLTSDAATVGELGAGGLSGRPLAKRALAVLELLRSRVGDDLTLVAAGGISTAGDARARIDAGATLVQAYTGFVYGGPLWPRRIVTGLG